MLQSLENLKMNMTKNKFNCTSLSMIFNEAHLMLS